MSLGNARKFLRTAMTTPEFRSEFEDAPGAEGRKALFQDKKLEFTLAELDEAIDTLMVQCATEEAAYEVQQVVLWWQLLDHADT